MAGDNPEMPSQKAIEIVNLLEENNIDIVIDGGWGADVLSGNATLSSVIARDICSIFILAHLTVQATTFSELNTLLTYGTEQVRLLVFLSNVLLRSGW